MANEQRSGRNERPFRRREQSSMTILRTVLPGEEHRAALVGALGVIGRDVGCRRNNHLIRFADFGQIHFARWSLLPPERENGPWQLVFGTDHDGDDRALLWDLAERAMPALEAVYAHCEGWPGARDPTAVVDYLYAGRVRYAARHIACRGRSVAELRQAVDDRRRMQECVDDVIRPGLGPCPAPSESEREAAHRTVARIAEHTGATLPPRRAPWNWQLPVLVGAALLVAGWIVSRLSTEWRIGVLAALVGLVVAYILALRAQEKRDAAAWEPTPAPDLSHLARLRGWEDQLIQNQMTHLVPVKGGRLRRWTLRVVFEAVDLLARFYWNRGDLGGIPSIHFARWALVDGGRRLLFFSNFDGSWENYLGDFIDRASVGLTGVWSNTEGFPPTSGLIGFKGGDGSRRASEFKNWTRRYQIETQVWYSAYPDVTVVNLLDALALCEGREVAADPPGDNATAWLQRL
ncbi:MAG TPA: hypothetical protein VM490_25730 [Armatimonadaceae bacterium]|nr:hypothetical protein [Armatimonadaceae bacterium]